jgi:tRNA pseudouridine synthase 10
MKSRAARKHCTPDCAKRTWAPSPPANSPGWTPGEWLKTEINREIGRNLEAATGKKVDFERPELTFRVDTRFDHVALQSADLFARGRYRKLVRDLPQTRWPCRACNGLGCRQCGGRGKTYETSVEELIAAPLVEAAQAEQEAFHGMGREDIDARMLGNGRPFILELKRPRKRSLDWTQIAARINASNIGRVEVDQLARAGPEDAARYKAADPDKNYVAVCRSETPVSRGDLEAALHRLEGAELQQRTPQRVSHRRSDLVRKRVIQRLRIVDVGEDTFTIEIRADSGTYIKEFVSGDEGRTQPSLAGTVGVPMRVTELDVIDVDWVGEEAKAPQVSPQER